jgi:hypothetical protein
MTTIRVFSPVGRPHRHAAADWHRSELRDVRGGVLGIVDNTKPNARALMHGVAQRLSDAALVSDVSIIRKGGPAEGVTDAGFGTLEHEVSIVLVGSAD